jgi:hypothetical protein
MIKGLLHQPLGALYRSFEKNFVLQRNACGLPHVGRTVSVKSFHV